MFNTVNCQAHVACNFKATGCCLVYTVKVVLYFWSGARWRCCCRPLIGLSQFWWPWVTFKVYWKHLKWDIFVLLFCSWQGFNWLKPPQHFVRASFNFDTPLSCIATLPQSPPASHPRSWPPSTNPPYFSLASFPSLFLPSLFPSFPAPFLPLCPVLTPFIYAYNMPVCCCVGLYCTLSIL